VTDTDDDGYPDSVDKDDDDDGICDYGLSGSNDTCSGREESSSCDTKADCDGDGSSDQYDCWDTDNTKKEGTISGTQICCNGALKCTPGRSSECYVSSLMTCTNHAENCAEYGTQINCNTACRTCGSDRKCSNYTANGYDDLTSPGLCTTQSVCWNGNCTSDEDDDGIPDLLDLTVTLNSPVNDTWDTDGNVTFNFTVTSMVSSVFNCSLRIDGIVNKTTNGVSNNTPTVFAVNNINEGSHVWNVNCSDSSGNWDVDVNRIIKVDVRAPGLMLSAPGNNTWYNSNTVIFNFTTVDTIDNSMFCMLYVDNMSSGSGSYSNGTMSSITKSGVSDGNHTWWVNCSDDAGNSNRSETRLVKVDAIAPQIVLNFPANNSWDTDATVDFNFTVSDNIDLDINCSFYLDGHVNQTLNISNSSTTVLTRENLSEGNHTWYAVCRDDATNTRTSETRIIKVDTIPPNRVTNFNTLPNDNGSITLTWNLSNSTDVWLYRVYTSNSWEFNYTNPTNISNSATSWLDSNASSYSTRYYNIRALDYASNQENNTLRVGKVGTEQLAYGWRLISTTHTDAESMVGNISNCTSLAKYVNSENLSGFQVHRKNTPAFNFNTTPSEGYYLYCQSNRSFTAIGGDVPSREITLHNGWNLIGWASVFNTTAQWLVDNITNAVAVGQFVQNTTNSFEKQNKLFNPKDYDITALSTGGSNTSSVFEVHVDNSPLNNFTISAGKGYFVYVLGNSTWSVGIPISVNGNVSKENEMTTPSMGEDIYPSSSVVNIPLHNGWNLISLPVSV